MPSPGVETWLSLQGRLRAMAASAPGHAQERYQGYDWRFRAVGEVWHFRSSGKD